MPWTYTLMLEEEVVDWYAADDLDSRHFWLHLECPSCHQNLYPRIDSWKSGGRGFLVEKRQQQKTSSTMKKLYQNPLNGRHLTACFIGGPPYIEYYLPEKNPDLLDETTGRPKPPIGIDISLANMFVETYNATLDFMFAEYGWGGIHPLTGSWYGMVQQVSIIIVEAI